jgi:hypothetical protein
MQHDDGLTQMSITSFFSARAQQRQEDEEDMEDQEGNGAHSSISQGDGLEWQHTIEDVATSELQSAEEYEESEESEEIAEIAEISDTEEDQAEDGTVSNVLDDIKGIEIADKSLLITEETDGVSEWVMDLLDDAPSKSMAQLEEMALDGLQSARRKKIYRDESLFAALVDFYRWTPRYG